MALSVMANILLFVAVLLLTVSEVALGQTCTSGFLGLQEMKNAVDTELLPQLGRRGRNRTEQWIFPSMQFTCNGTLTKWVFRGRNVNANCRVDMQTWRLLGFFDATTTVYEQTSSTRKEGATVTFNEPFFTYELDIPAKVVPGDLIGVEMRRSCITKGIRDNILSLEVSGRGNATLSFWERQSDPLFFTDSTNPIFTEMDIIPLVQAVIEVQGGSTTATLPSVLALKPSSNLENAFTPTADDNNIVFNNQPEEEGASSIAIAAGVPGGFVGMVALVAACICVGWLRKHVQVHVHYVNTKHQHSDSELERQNQVNSNTIPVQMNVAYKQVQSNRQIINGITDQTVVLNQALNKTQGHEEIEHETEREVQMFFKNVAYHSNPRVHNQLVVSPQVQLPIQQLPTITNDEEHHYECIL